MDINKTKSLRRSRRKRRVRKNVFGTTEAPRMTVYRSRKHIYVQVIDDLAGRTLCAAGTTAKELKDAITYGGNRQAASAIGKAIAERAQQAGITRVKFDRNGFAFHGRVKALADAAREGGLEF